MCCAFYLVLGVEVEELADGVDTISHSTIILSYSHDPSGSVVANGL